MWLLHLVRTALIVALAAIPAAAHENNDNSIVACISPEGRVRVVSAAGHRAASPRRGAAPCLRGERLVIWNIKGLEGPAGPSGRDGEPGLAGERGPAGEQGPPGLGFSGPQFYTVGNGDLRPVGGGAFGTSFGPFPGGTFSTAASPLLAGVHLPQRATVVAVRAHVFDNSASDLIVELIEQPLTGDLPLSIASTTSSGTAATPYTVESEMFATHDVDNARFHYFVRVSPTPGWTATTLQVLGVTIEYRLHPSPGS